MPAYTQTNRPLRIDTVLETDRLMLARFEGVEAVSTPFSFRLELVSEHEDISSEDMLRTPAVVSFDLPDGSRRHIHGIINRFTELARREDLVFYRAELVPWLWFLSLARDCRIFQNLSVLEIVEQVFQDQGYSDFEVKTTRSYPKRVFCVQYRETNLDFVSRLLEDEGIFYFFEHDENKHVLVLADSKGPVEPILGDPRARFALQATPGEEVVSSIEREVRAQIGTVTLRDYDYLQPSLRLENTLSGDGQEEVYDYPGKYTTLEEGDRYARLRLETEEALRQVIWGASSCRGFQSGCRFDLEGHFRSDVDASYAVLRVHHRASGGDYRAWDTAPFDYQNEFLAIPYDTPYHPAHQTPRPLIRGLQTALVVGPSGEEVYVDKHGRIKVHFYWDRVNQRDDSASCWVRVATPWGGKGWGSVSIPRIGNEVVVEFLEGDPDRPLVVGSVYNADQTTPFGLPDAGIQMGMKSRSSPGGGGYNEITMTDTKGEEMLNIHAQYDMVTTVEHDDTQHIKNDRKITVDATHTETIKKNTSITVTEGDHTTKISAGKQTNTVSKDIAITSETAKIHVKAATEIKLEVGASSLLMKTDGTIELKGVQVSIKGSGGVTVKGDAMVTIKGGVVHSEADAEHQTKGAIVLSEGSATNTIKGGMVMLNP